MKNNKGALLTFLHLNMDGLFLYSSEEETVIYF